MPIESKQHRITMYYTQIGKGKNNLSVVSIWWMKWCLRYEWHLLLKLTDWTSQRERERERQWERQRESRAININIQLRNTVYKFNQINCFMRSLCISHDEIGFARTKSVLCVVVPKIVEHCSYTSTFQGECGSRIMTNHFIGKRLNLRC